MESVDSLCIRNDSIRCHLHPLIQDVRKFARRGDSASFEAVMVNHDVVGYVATVAPVLSVRHTLKSDTCRDRTGTIC